MSKNEQKKVNDADHTECVLAMQNLEKLLREAREEVREGQERELKMWRILGEYLLSERNALNRMIQEAQG